MYNFWNKKDDIEWIDDQAKFPWQEDKEDIEWIDDRAKLLWQEDKELTNKCGETWRTIVKATESFAEEIQRRIRDAKVFFEDIVDEVMASIKKTFKLDKTQINLMISNLAWNWKYGEQLRIWNNARLGIESKYALVFA